MRETLRERIADVIADHCIDFQGIPDGDSPECVADRILALLADSEPHESEWREPGGAPADDCPHRRAVFVWNDEKGGWVMEQWLDDSEPVSWAYWAASGASLTDSPAEAQMWRDAGYNVVSLYTSPTPTKPEGGEG